MTLPASGAISFSAVNIELGLSSTAQISLNDAAVRTLFGDASGAVAMSDAYGKSNTSVPGAPTSVSASATGSSSASVSFSAPACTGHLTIDYYQAISTPGCITATGTSPISVTGLSPSTSYTFRVRAHNSKGYGCYSSASNSITTSAPRGCATYTTPGTYTWAVPSGVSKISIVAIGAGGSSARSLQFYCCYNGIYFNVGSSGGGGAALNFRNNYSPTLSSYTVVVAGALAPCTGANIGTMGTSPASQFYCGYLQGGGGGSAGAYYGGTISSCTGGGPGGTTSGTFYVQKLSAAYQSASGTGGGGAGGYSCAGSHIYCAIGGYGGANRGDYTCSCRIHVYQGSNASYNLAGALGTGNYGGGGGGAATYPYTPGTFSGSYAVATIGYGAGGGGGVGIYGRGSNGGAAYCSLQGGYGGSCGTNGGNGGTCGLSGAGGSYGGGAGGPAYHQGASRAGAYGGGGAVRIVWPGNTRLFPSTDVGSP